MTTPFETDPTEELDALWQEALFLEGGDRAGAEALLLGALTDDPWRDFAAYAPSDSSSGLERVVLRRFLQSVGGDADTGSTPVGGATPAPRGDAVVTTRDVYTAAEMVPPAARAALWLVLIRRCSYSAAAELLEIDRASLLRLLGFRDAFMSAALRSARAPRDARRAAE